MKNDREKQLGVKMGFKKLSLIVVLCGVFLMVSGCEEKYTYDECYELLPTDPNMAAGMAIVQTAKTEATAKAKIAQMTEIAELFCIGSAVVCVAGIFLGRFLQSKLIVQLCAIGIVVFAVGWALLAAKVQYPKTIAAIGLIMLLSVFAALVVIIIINRKALVQVVTGNEKFKENMKQTEHLETIPLEQFKINQRSEQDVETTKIVDSIRKTTGDGP